MKFRLDVKFLLIAIALFIIEACIAIFINDDFVRPFLGDVLVVLLIYFTVRAFVDSDPFKTAIAVLIFAFAIEAMQYMNIVEALGLQNFKIARIVLGTRFSWLDMICYTVGFAIIIGWEYGFNRPEKFETNV